MKIIFSRKGCDGKYGASPIFEDGRLLSLPIPYVDSHGANRQGINYREINSGIREFPLVFDIVQQLAPRIAEMPAHLDPDLNNRSIPREPGWRGLYGQSGGIQTQLNGVDKGDLVLFFGRFRRVVPNLRPLRFVPETQQRAKHVLFGWLQVDKPHILPGFQYPNLPANNLPDWAAYHPHALYHQQEFNPNVIYAASTTLDSLTGTPGWGLFQYYSDSICLTHPQRTSSFWRVTASMYPWRDPLRPRTPLTLHNDPLRWTDLTNEHVTLHTTSPGQEFVLDADQYPEVKDWATNLIKSNSQCN
jgi:hypothetical protein